MTSRFVERFRLEWSSVPVLFRRRKTSLTAIQTRYGRRELAVPDNGPALLESCAVTKGGSVLSLSRHYSVYLSYPPIHLSLFTADRTERRAVSHQGDAGHHRAILRDDSPHTQHQLIWKDRDAVSPHGRLSAPQCYKVGPCPPAFRPIARRGVK